MKKAILIIFVLFASVNIAQTFIRFDVQNLEAGPAAGPWMCESTIPANPFVNDNIPGNGDYAYKFVSWNTVIGDPNPIPCTGIDELSSSTCLEEQTIVLDAINNVTLKLDGFTLAQFHHINTVDPNANWNVLGRAGDERIYAGGWGEIKVNDEPKLKATNCRITLKVCYSAPMGEGDIVTGSGWGVIDAASSDAAWVAEFDPEGTGQLEFEFESFSPVLQSCYGKYDAVIKVKPAPNQEILEAKHTYEGEELYSTVALEQSDVSFKMNSATKGGAADDEDFISANQVKKAPGGDLPDGVASVSECYWQLGTTLSSFNTDVTFDLSDLSGLNPNGLKILKRATTDAAWQVYANVTEIDADHIKANAVESFSEFGIGSEALDRAYTIGTGGDFTTINDAVTALIANGVSSAVTFNILTGTYTEQITIPAITGASADNIITFQSQTTNAADVTMQYSASSADDNWIIKLDGCSYINFKYLTLTTVNITYSTAILFSNSPSHITISHCIINGEDTFPHPENGYVISGQNTKSEYIEISYNNINYGYMAIILTPPDFAQRNIIANNTFNLQYLNALQLQRQQDLSITNNVINSGSGVDLFLGLDVVIANNKINTTMAGWRGISTQTAVSSSDSPNLIYNNMISGPNGLISIGSPYSYIYYNTIKISGSADINSVALSCGGIDCKVLNNVAINKRNGYAYKVTTPSDINNSDYNNFYSTGTNIASWGGTDYATVAALTAVSGKDAHSISRGVNFVSATDLHLAGTSIGDTYLIGTPIAGITTDFDGDIRHAVYPYMGADENLASPLPVELSSFTAAVTNNSVNLNWTTKTEVNTYGFEIQRSEIRDQKSEWEKVGFVEGHGNSNSPKEYNFVDNTSVNGKFSYRLKMIDNDGTFEYSDIVEVEINSIPSEFFVNQNYPNPFNPVTTFKYGLVEDATVTIDLYNCLGQKVSTLLQQTQSAGVHYQRVDGNNLANGTYILNIRVEGTKEIKNKSIKLILLK